MTKLWGLRRLPKNYPTVEGRRKYQCSFEDFDCGSWGSGKTTLVKNVYESRRVQSFFDCYAFIDVPCPFDSRMLFLNMLSQFESQIMQEPVPHHHLEEIDPKAKLKKFLEKKRYAVVLDNVWREKDLVSIVNALPNGSPGSKIIITTRHSALASSHATASKYIHDLSEGLSMAEANKLFCKKAFHGDCDKCPKELDVLAQKIILRCDGLPLAISAAGSFLAHKQQTHVEWEKFYKSLSSNVPIIRQVCEPSYRDLQDHFKRCFLYFSMFPQDTSIKRERLIRLWIAEGFVPWQRTELTMEEVADGYLNELIGRNLVHASSKEIDGQVRSCCVLNLVREFIISKAESFFPVLDSNNTSTNSGDNIRRLSAHYVPINSLSGGGRYSLNRTRTLLVFGPAQHGSTSQNSELEKVLKTLENLRILDLKGVPLDDFPKSIVGLTLLKYISMRKTKIKSVPSSIEKLILLETLDLKRTQVTKLPREIYELKNLRHLLVSHGCDHDDGPVQGVEVPDGNIGALSALQKLSLIKVGNNRTILKGLAQLIGLRKLGLTDVKAEHATDLCCAIEKMVCLSTLEVRSTSEKEYLDLDPMTSPPPSLQRLSMKGRLRSLPQWINDLHSVVKIGLKRSKLNDDANPLEPLQALPNLMVLDLVDYYTGKELEFKVGTFKKLHILRMEQFDHVQI